jgi:hypothetical protein
MAQFAKTFTIYGSMAIVIERTAHAAIPRPAAARHVIATTPRATPSPTATPVAWVPTNRVRIASGFDAEDSAGIAAASLGLLTGVTAVSAQPLGAVVPLLVAGSLVLVAAGALLVVLERRRRRRRQCAG